MRTTDVAIDGKCALILTPDGDAYGRDGDPRQDTISRARGEESWSGGRQATTAP